MAAEQLTGGVWQAPTTKMPPAPGIAGWQGTTTEPALGPLDRINTTDVPEEIEARPDKSRFMACLVWSLTSHSILLRSY